jgi:hypothetical protein
LRPRLSVHTHADRVRRLGPARGSFVAQRHLRERETVTKGAEPTGATLDHALKDMEERSRELQRDPPPRSDDSGVLVNKTA